jgi:hypothetical protein
LNGGIGGVGDAADDDGIAQLLRKKRTRKCEQ